MTESTKRNLRCLHYILLENVKLKCDKPRYHKGSHRIDF